MFLWGEIQTDALKQPLKELGMESAHDMVNKGRISILGVLYESFWKIWVSKKLRNGGEDFEKSNLRKNVWQIIFFVCQIWI